MNIRIELRYSILLNLLMLLWLSLEFMIGLQDKYIEWHPYVTMFALIIPVICGRLVVKDKIEQLNGRISFKQAFLAGFLVAVFSAIFSIPMLLIFLRVINPDFFTAMIAAGVNMHHMSPTDAANYFNEKSYMIQTVTGTLAVGTIIAAVMAWRMRTPN